MQSIHGPLKLGIYLPSSAVLYLLSQFSLSLDEGVHGILIHRLAKFEIDFLVFLEYGHYLAYSFLYYFEHCLVWVHLRLLLQVAYTVAGSPYYLSLIAWLHSRNDLHESGLTASVESDDAYFCPVEKRKTDILEYDFVAVG